VGGIRIDRQPLPTLPCSRSGIVDRDREAPCGETLPLHMRFDLRQLLEANKSAILKIEHSDTSPKTEGFVVFAFAKRADRGRVLLWINKKSRFFAEKER
jgi:hypothetical protein